jgi:hypothetical protein
VRFSKVIGAANDSKESVRVRQLLLFMPAVCGRALDSSGHAIGDERLPTGAGQAKEWRMT